MWTEEDGLVRHSIKSVSQFRETINTMPLKQ